MREKSNCGNIQKAARLTFYKIYFLISLNEEI